MKSVNRGAACLISVSAMNDGDGNDDSTPAPKSNAAKCAASFSSAAKTVAESAPAHEARQFLSKAKN